METKHVVMFSGGVGSWAAAKRVREANPGDEVVLLFTDTLIEDDDLYRFLVEAAANVANARLFWIADGRDPWEVFRDVRYLGNTRADPCSKILKRDLAAAWLDENCDRASTIIYLGISWDEAHRFAGAAARARYRALGWELRAPMCDEPHLAKGEVFDWLEAEGIKRPRLYDEGFSHNNCGGFCVKAGQGHFLHLLMTRPELFAHHELKEQELREHLGKDVAILRDRTGGTTRPMTLRQLRMRAEGVEEGQIEMFDWGGCGCFL